MSQENQGMSPAAPQTFPLKRKRGRPRKDGQIHVEKVPAKDGQIRVEKVPATPKPDVVTRNQRRKVNLSIGPDNPMVGQVVSGVLDGSFDAGYLLTVRVGDTDTILRGVVFAPGLSVPVSGANDVAPHVKMLKRFEVPLSAVSSPLQMRGSSSQYEQKSELLQRSEGSLPAKVAAPVKAGPVTSKGVQEDAKLFPEATTQTLQQAEDKNLNSATLYSGGQLNDNNKVVQVSSQAKDNQVQKTQLPETQSNLSDLPAIGGGLGDTNKGPIISTQQAAQTEFQKEPASSDDGNASKDSKLEPKTEASVRISLDLVNPQSEQTAGSDIKHDQRIDVAPAYQAVGTNKAPTATEPQALATGQVTESIKMFPKDQPPEEHRTIQQESEIVAEVPSRVETIHHSLSEADEPTKRGARPNPSVHPLVSPQDSN